jgi:hypothetical protein
MELIERYLHAIGRYLPGGKREDILAELRSTLEDQVEARAGGDPGEGDAAAVIKAMGPPRQVAAAYFPAGQYVIGPDLFPLYSTILGLVLAASIGGQLIALAVSVFIAGNTVDYLETFWDIFNALPATFGVVTLIFYALQRLEVKPETPESEFDPAALAPIVDAERVNRGEHLFSILAGAVFLAFLTWFFGAGGVDRLGLDVIFVDPIIERYFIWIAASIFAGIVVDILLLWRGGWQTSTRLLRMAANLFSLGVLSVLIQGHADWLRDAGIQPSITAFGDAAGVMGENIMLIIMLSVWIALVVSAVTILVQTVVTGIRLVRGLRR